MASLLKKKQFWGALIAIGIMVYLFYDLDLARSLELARGLKSSCLIPALVCSFGIVVFKTLRWMTIVSKVKKLIFWPTLCLYSTAQIIAALLPALTGQAGRVILFSKRGNFTKTYVFSTIFLEVVLDGAGLISLMLLSSSVIVFPRQYRYISFIIAGATVLVLALFYCSLHFQKRLEETSYRRLRPKSPRMYLVLKKFLRSFNEGISVIRSMDKLFLVSANTLLSWACHVGTVYFLFLAFGFKLPVLSAVVIIIVNYLALMIPITPGNLGSFQLAVVASLNIFSISKTEGVLFSVMLYLMDLVPLLVLASFFLFKGQFSISEIGQEDALMAEVDNMVADAGPEAESRVSKI